MKEMWSGDEKIRSLLKKQKPDLESRYRWSQFVLQFEEDGKHYLYNTLTRQCLEADRSLPGDTTLSFEQIRNDPDLTALAEDYFLVPEHKDEIQTYQGLYRLMRAYAKKKGFKGYTILPTLGCNARCVYCYEKGRPQPVMNRETVERTIRYILETRREKAEIHFSWFGGEPLLRTDVIDTICKAMRENGIAYRSSIITNGSLITDGIIDKMIADWNLKKAQISMDCAEKEYIARRNYYSYDNTYWQVIKNAEKLARRGVRVAIRCNVDAENMDRIPDFLADLEGAIRDKSNIAVYFAPLFDFQYSPEYHDFWKRILATRESVERAGFHPMSGSNLRSFRVNHCMADQPSGTAVITPDGDLYTCEHCEPGTSHGNIFEGITKPDILRSFLEDGMIREKCRNCVLLPECTPFSKCPGQQAFCKEIGTGNVLYSLRKMIRNQSYSSPADGDDSDDIC